MEWLYLFVSAFLLVILWFFARGSECYIETGWLVKLKRQLTWISRRKKSQGDASSDSVTAMDELIDGVNEKIHDSNILCYYGADQNNNFVFIKINRRKDKYTELTFFLVFEDGRTYALPDHPNIAINDDGNSRWSAAGLKISVVEPTKRARVTFNGLLCRRRNHADVNYNVNADVEHVRFNCIFIACARPYPRDEFWSSELQAKTLGGNPSSLEIVEFHQYGSMIGQVTFEDSTSVDLYLRGMRQCCWGRCDAARFDRSVCFTGVDDIGVSFYVNVANVKDGINNVQIGHVKDPNENLFPMKSLSLHIDKFIDRYENGCSEFNFEFTAGKKKYETFIRLCRKTQIIVRGGYPWDSQYAFHKVEMRVNDVTGVGLIQIWQPHYGDCPIKLSPIRRYIKPKEANCNAQIYTISFRDRRCQNENLVGGKGASLAALSSIETDKFTVPKGFCVTAHALESQIKHHPNISSAINELLQACSDGKIDALKERGEKIVTLMKNTPVYHMVEVKILQALKELEVDDGERRYYAIRSSAIGEDSEDTSAAGQNSTYLGIKIVNEVVKLVAHCWASLYTYQSVEYRRQHGLPIKASMGVCIQQMVNAEAAGVMFSRHPITGNPKEILITSNYGLGESVVSALVNPDTITVQRIRGNSLAVKSSEIGNKKKSIIMDSKSSGGTRTSDLTSRESSTLSISTDTALKLAEIGVKLDEFYGAPRDIEWAVLDRRVYLLQCRPVTALDAWSDFELIHELGSGVPSGSDVLMFSNVGEVLPMVITPLTCSSVIRALRVCTEMSVTRKPALDTYGNDMFIVNSRCTLNYMSLMLRFVEEKITISNRVFDIGICGRSILTPELHELAKKRNGVLKSLGERLLLTGHMLLDLWRNAASLRFAERIVQRYRRSEPIVHDLEALDAVQIYRALADLADDLTRTCWAHTRTTSCSAFQQVVVMSVLAKGSDECTTEHYSDIALLLTSCSDVISAQVPIALREITQTIKQSGLADEFKVIESSEAMKWLQLHCPKAHVQVQEFVQTHGHRGFEEFELITETWSMRPEKFLAIIQSMVVSDDKSRPNEALTPGETIALLKTPCNRLARWILHLMLPATRRAVERREQTKALVIEMVHKMRLAYRRLALLLRRQGRLPDDELVFFLTHAELGELLARPCPSLVRKAVKRRKIRSRLQQYRYQEVNFGFPQPIEFPKMTKQAVDGQRIQGTPVCNGIITGRVCVALTLEEAKAIQPGDILITCATDIGWSPYFPLLGGIATEIGGLISHGAVIAREYGLPSIVNAENATRLFKTGDTVTLNGNTGTIELVGQSTLGSDHC